MKMLWRPEWRIKCFDREGNLKWEEYHDRNMLHDEGEQFILEAVFSEAQSVPASYYIRLANDTLVEGDTLSDILNEEAGTGYAAEAVNSDATDWTVSQDAGDYQAVSKTVTFTATAAGWTAVNVMYLATTSNDTGKLIASVALSASRTLANGDSLQTDITIKLSE